jgi:trehalose 6-phosphate synthase/phosphatase
VAVAALPAGSHPLRPPRLEYDLFRLLPWHEALLRGLLACDGIGFQTDGYVRNFIDCAERTLRARVDRETGRVEHAGGITTVWEHPIGIDRDYFESLARTAPRAADRAHRVILGADRLDYTKGIPQRIRAIERLFDRHPEHRERVVLLQIAVPSRSQAVEYRELKREIDELVGRVNGRFATASWSPIRYLYRSFQHDRLAALYRDADVALVTPLRDGMNLVAKEFVACQVGDPGVLVLSRLAGASEIMPEALLVNPYDEDETAEALHRALGMEVSERRGRMDALRLREHRHDAHAWVESALNHP